MNKKVVWMVVSGWMVAALLLTSCAPAAVEEAEAAKVAPKEKEVVVPKEEVVPKEVMAPKEEANMVKWTGTKLDGTVVEKMIEKPKYGGTLTLISDRDRFEYNRAALWRSRPPGYIFPTNETLLFYDQLRGPGGTGERSAVYNLWDPNVMAPGLAESWEVISPDTIKYRIRKGVRFHDKPPINGAEMTVEDVLWSLRMPWMSIARYKKAYPYIANVDNPKESIYIDPEDSRVIVVKAANLAMAWRRTGVQLFVMPKALDQSPSGYDGEHFGGTHKGVIGTGPFMIKDRIRESSLTWVRNPDYWGRDAFFPENQLPYIDRINLLIISDKSTQVAAFRTGKIDILIPARYAVIDKEGRDQLSRTNPELKWAKVVGGGNVLSMRHDVAPWNDVRVRRAGNMAIDQDELVEAYYGGEAWKFYNVVWPIPDHEAYWIPLEEMPEIVREMNGYHPDKAKQLLAEAGYPDGFTTEIVVWSTAQIDLAILVKNYWAKVGIELDIKVVSFPVFESMSARRTHEQGIWDNPLESYYVTFRAYYSPATTTNKAIINERWIDEVVEASFGVAYLNPDEHVRLIREAIPKVEEFAPFIRLPLFAAYIPWHPWVKGYNGEIYGPSYGADHVFTTGKYVWIDQELKKTMTR